VLFEPGKIRAAIKKAGYEMRDFEVTLKARVEHLDEAYRLHPEGIAQTFAVRPAGGTSELEGYVGKMIRAKGKVVNETPPIELELTEVEPTGG